ncbi:hypothetical protein EGW08_001788 [Elysia chlorotica]|uniref:Uncharacterized protein n=1 Tax=Elysia chlorotica TaxID=188477 RepID=A0A433U9F4_ELYCH|nr:hypothetical protein EGW08_001788 [Elysia chlorotica]
MAYRPLHTSALSLNFKFSTTNMRSDSRFGHALRKFYVAAIFATSLLQGILGCFPNDEVFKTSCLWTQSFDIDSHYRIDVCGHYGDAGKGSRMTFTPIRKGAIYQKEWHWDCVKATSIDQKEFSYLVKRGNSEETLGYQCVRFSPLTQNVVRQRLTSITKNMVNCNDAIYSLDSHVLVASGNLESKTCPLIGGYQVLMHLPYNAPSDRNCLENAATIKPHLQFGCAQTGSSRVLANLGAYCTPDALLNSYAMRGRAEVHLDCVESWQENTGTKEQSTNVLLRMDDSNSTFWCLHVQRVANPSHSAVSFADETLYKSFLTFDGRCGPHMNGDNSVPKPTTMFGHLAAFRPGNDSKCQEPSYLNGCESEKRKCQTSTDCPKSCGRCLEELPSSFCSIPAKFHGSWESFFFDQEDKTLISTNSIRTPKQGEFKCLNPDGTEGHDQGVFSLVQKGEHLTCMPHRSCVLLDTPAPGILTHRRFPPIRTDTGEIKSCSMTDEINRLSYRKDLPEVVTLVQPEKVEATACDQLTTKHLGMVNTGSSCRLTLHECQGSCHTFNVSLEADSCDNQTAEDLGLLTQHTCVAVLPVPDRWVVLTKSPQTEQYLCWVVLSTDIFLLSPGQCNGPQIESVMEDIGNVPNPLKMLKAIWPQEQKEPQKDRDGGVAIKASVTALVLTLAVTVFMTSL